MPCVRITCLLCEDPVEVPARDVVLHLEGSGQQAVNRYGFTCPVCAVYVVRVATAAVVDALLASDVELATGATPPWETGAPPGIVLVDSGPHEAREPGARAERHREAAPARHGPALTEADVLLFRRALEDDAILAAWLSA